MLFAFVGFRSMDTNSLYAFGYMRGSNGKTRPDFFTCFAMAIGFAIGCLRPICSRSLHSMSSDILDISIVLTIKTLQLSALGRIYMGILVSTSVCLLSFGARCVAPLWKYGFHARWCA